MAARGLGKGLDALIPANVSTNTTKKTPATKTKEETAEKANVMKLSEIEPNREQPRQVFDEESLNKLADSIKQVGLLQPLLVTKKKDYYMIVAGERRWRAAKIAGLKEVPVIVKDLTEKEIAVIALVENLQREDLNPIEEAKAYRQLLDQYEMTQDDVAKNVSKSRSAITNSLRLLKLTPAVQKMVSDEKLSYGHARALIPVEDGKEQERLAQKIIDENLNVREVEKLIRDLAKTTDTVKTRKKSDPQMTAVYASIEEQLKNGLGTKVTLKPKDNGSGKLEIEFYSHEDLERIIERLS